MSSTKLRYYFSSSDNQIILDHLKEVKDTGDMSDNGFKSTVWEALAAKLNKDKGLSGSAKTVSSCKDRMANVSVGFY